MKNKIWIYLLIVCLLIVCLEGINGSCRYTYQTRNLYRRQHHFDEVVCSYKNCKYSIPAVFGKNCYIIVISSSNIVNFSSTTIKVNSPVDYIEIHNSSLSAIEKGAFLPEHYLDLQDIHFPQNNLSKIESGVFKGLSYLSVLNLTQNQIETVEDNAFDSLERLTSLDLSENRLKLIGSKYFVGLSKLNTLFLNGNNIYTIEINAFNSLNALAYVDGPEFTNFATNIFEQSLHVKEINISKTKVPDIEVKGVNLLKKMAFLDLHLNVTRLVENSFEELVMLRKLNLNGNQLTNIDSGAFKGLINLRILNITDFSLSVLATNFTKDLQTVVVANFSLNSINILEVDNFDNFSRLVTLDLSHNILDALPVGYFGHLNSLEHLDLSHNYITTLELGTFVGLVSLKFLNLNHNKIATMPTIVFHNTPQLSSIDVSDNLFTNLDPLKLKTFTKLTTINVDNNFFDCHTLSKTIEQLKSVGVEIVYGTTRKLTGINGVICRVDEITTLLDNRTPNLSTFNTSNETRAPEQLFKYLEANPQLLKEAVQESSNTSQRMYNVIQLLKEVEEKIKEGPVKESICSQSHSQNNNNEFVKLFNAVTTRTVIIEVALILMVVCLFCILLLLAAKTFREFYIFKNRNFFERSSNVEEQIML